MPGYLTKSPRATIHDMPPEVLSRIFAILASDRFGTIDFSLDWITVTHVCKFWNQVARDNPTLWSSIDFFHPQWAKEKLRRAKSVPLYLDYRHDGIQGDEEAGKEALSQALNKLPLIKTAIIEGPVDVLEGFVEKMCGLPAPIIEDLRLLGPRDEFIDISLRGDLFKGIAPRLKYAVLLGVSMGLKTTFFRSIEILVLGPMQHLASIPDMLILLSNLPKLVTLRTAFAFQKPDDSDFSRLASMEPVLMPSCRFIQAIGAGNDADMENPVATPTMFLQWVKFAQPVKLEIIMSWYSDEFHGAATESYEQIFGPLDSHYSAHEMQFVELEMTHSVRTQTDDVKEQLDLYARSKNNASILLTFWFLDEMSVEHRRHLAEEFASRLPCDDLKSVSVAAVDIEDHTWRSLFGELKHLEEIKAYLYEGFFHALNKNDRHHEGRCTFPSLSKLTLYYDDEDEEKSDQRCWQDLPKVLEFRATHGAPVREIVILPEDPVPQEYLTPLASFVTVRDLSMY